MDYPSFTEAVIRFHSFLHSLGWRHPIRWVFLDDVLFIRGKFYVRERSATQVVDEVLSLYNLAPLRRLGVELRTLFRAEGYLWCRVFVPENKAEAVRCLMPDGLKICVTDGMPFGQIVQNKSEWEKLQPLDEVEQKLWRF